MATNKNRTSSRKKTPLSNSKGYVSRSIIAWRYLTRSYVIVCISLIVLIATMLAVYLGYTSYIANEAQASDKERTAFSTASKVLRVLKPELVKASPNGTRWVVDEQCRYTYRAIHEGDRYCLSFLKGVFAPAKDDDIQATVLSVERVLGEHPQYFRATNPVIYPNLDPNYLGHSAGGGYDFEIQGIDCSNTYTIYSRGELTIEIGCSLRNARQEYFPTKG